MDNICRFLSSGSNEQIHIINFVLETKPQMDTKLKPLSVYRMHLVLEGTGFLHMPGERRLLKPGDLFFCMPAVPYALESREDFRYCYISYLGTRANALMDTLKISSSHCLFHGFEALRDLWQQGVAAAQSISGLRSESILLYSFSILGEQLLVAENPEDREDKTALRIKKYVDDHFSDSALSLEQIGQALSYNPRYVSAAFKNRFHMGVSEYLNTVRLQHACVLMEQGFTSIQGIAAMCGYKDPMYFSRVFRAKVGQSPRSYLTTRKSS